MFIHCHLSIAAPPASAGGFGDTNEDVIDLSQMPSDTEDTLETTMSRLDISQMSEVCIFISHFRIVHFILFAIELIFTVDPLI